MSTYLHLVCLDHDPPLVADGESGQHWYDLPHIRDWVANREALVTALDLSDVGHPFGTGHFYGNTVEFLAQHRKCAIGIRSEYGEDVPIVDDGADSE